MAGATFGEKLKGTFDLLLLFGRGIKPFEKEGTFRHAMLSLWIPVLMMPLNFVAAYLHRPEGLEEVPYSTVAIITGGMGVLAFIVGTFLSYLFAIAMDRKDRFWLWFQVGNWMTLPFNIIGVPVLAISVADIVEKAEMDRVLTAITYYGVLVSACVAFRALKIGWEMAGFYACMMVFAMQQIWNLMFYLNGVPIKWY